ncbi:MAG: tetratricopeptide repeat protein, partial [bacterium]
TEERRIGLSVKEDFSPRQPQRDEGDARQQQLFAEVDELLELERFGPAREIINEQIDKTRDSILERWIEKLAESYVREENYQEAIEQYRVLIEEFPDRKQAQWLFNIADAYREDGEDDQAQLILLRIRYRHRNSQIWPRAMRSLAEILTADENYDRARRILEEIIEGQNRNRHPKTILTLARLYDRQPVVRDYERAVEYYQKAARLLEDDEPEDADQARSRARYIIENYLQFGTE